jgi:hypothetical protein
VPIQIISETSVVAAQFDLVYEAANLSASSATGGGALVDHSVKSSEPGSGIRRVVLYSFGNAPIQNGVLVNIPLSISPGAPEGVVGLTLANVVLATSQATRVGPVTLSGGSLTISAVGEPPTITCPPDIVGVNDPGQCLAIVKYTATASAGATVICSPASGSPFLTGTAIVICAATDTTGQTATCSFHVTVSDKEPPVITLAGANPMTVECHTAFADPGGIANDACAGAVALSATGTVNVNAPGTYTIIYSALDPGGNTANATRSVTVVDSMPPTVSCPPAVAVAVGAECKAPVPNVLPTVTASDNCTLAGAVRLAQSPLAGTFVGLGLTPITVTATDAAGNSSTCTTPLTVVDSTAPTMICPANIVVLTPSPDETCAVVNYVAPAGADDCPGMTVICSPPSGSCFPLGTTTVKCTAIDATGNAASCTFSVIVKGAGANRCTKGKDYWRDNSAAWPVSSLSMGSQSYTQPELVALLKAPVRGDASVILARELIAAKLNIANSSDPTPIISTIQHADALMGSFSGKLPYRIQPSSSNGKSMIRDATELGEYNDGLLTRDCVP